MSILDSDLSDCRVMTGNVNDFCREWRSIITKIFGKSVGNKYESLMADIAAVDEGIKPGYLFDIGKPDANKTLCLLKKMKSSELIKNYLNVLQLGLDVIVVNPEIVRSFDISEMSLKKRLVNVSYKLSTPCLLWLNCKKDLSAFEFHRHLQPSCTQPTPYEGCKEIEKIINVLQIIKTNVNVDEILLYTIDEPECNVSTLFGLLLGYPVIYWYDLSDSCYGNCLSMETLTTVKLNVEFLLDKIKKKTSSSYTAMNKHCLYSFSYPTSLADHFDVLIQKWFDKVQSCLEKTHNFDKPDIVYKQVTLESVNL